jgi:hypothetical protein
MNVVNACAGFDLLFLNLDAAKYPSQRSGTSYALDLACCIKGLKSHLELLLLANLHCSHHYPTNLHIFTAYSVVS